MTDSHAAHVIVVGNEKGGTGKSTIALHLAVGLLQLGFSVAISDFDERQRSLLRYIQNRRACGAGRWEPLPCPRIYDPTASSVAGALSADPAESIRAGLLDVTGQTEFLIIDTPGAATPLARLAHTFADTLITPMNDSLLDLEVLARFAPGSIRATAPSHYSLLVLEQRRRLSERGAGLDWIVVRNRVTPRGSENPDHVGRILEKLAVKLRFRVAPRISERAIFREMFHTGTTVLDMDPLSALRHGRSHIAARVEMRSLFHALSLAQVDRKLQASANPWAVHRARC